MRDDGQGHARQPLNAPQDRHFLRRAKRQGDAFRPGPGRAADPVHIALLVVGQVVVDNVGNSLHVDTPGDDIGGDQDLDPPAIKRRQRSLAGTLVFVGMDRGGGDALIGQLLHHPVGSTLGPRKDQSAEHVFALEHLLQQIAFAILFDKEHLLVDSFRHRRRRRHLGVDRLVEHITG